MAGEGPAVMVMGSHIPVDGGVPVANFVPLSFSSDETEFVLAARLDDEVVAVFVPQRLFVEIS